MINLIKFLKLAENTLKRHNEGDYSYESKDCDFCNLYDSDCRYCPLDVLHSGNCFYMKTYKTDLRPEYWVIVISRIKTLILSDSTGKPEISRTELSEILWEIDKELAE